MNCRTLLLQCSSFLFLGGIFIEGLAGVPPLRESAERDLACSVETEPPLSSRPVDALGSSQVIGVEPHVCRALLAALDAAEGRRKQRKRDQTPDAIGLHAKRELLERAVREDPEPQAFEAWLLHYVETRADVQARGTTTAMARAVFEEWRLAHTLRAFATWLDCGAPSEDAENNALSVKCVGR